MTDAGNRVSRLPGWRRAYGGVVLDAAIRESPDDFQVTEVLGFEPEGDGEHDFLWVEKTGCNTLWVAEQLARFAGLRTADVGFSGLKDRNALTRQWFSVRRPAGPKADWRALESAADSEGLRVLDVRRHRRKLKRGMHRANHFRIALRPVSNTGPSVIERLQTLRAQGVPNYFGEQRFGRGGSNLQLAAELFAGRRMPRHKRSLALSAARACLFNHVLDVRIAAGSWNSLLPGDVANLDGSGSVFPVETVDPDLERRAAALDLHATGPMWGRGGTTVAGDIAALERAAAASWPRLARGLEEQGLQRARRALRVRVLNLEWALESSPEKAAAPALVLDFSLPRGAFATAVLRELSA